MKFIEDFCISYKNISTLYDYSIRNSFKSASIYIMPIVNYDNVNLVTDISKLSSFNYLKVKNIAKNFPNISFPDRLESKYNSVDLKNLKSVLKMY